MHCSERGEPSRLQSARLVAAVAELVRGHYALAHMNVIRISIGLTAALFMLGCVSAATNEADTWSGPTNGLQARLTFVEKRKFNGTRLLVPFLELKNVRDLAHPIEVRCDSHHPED